MPTWIWISLGGALGTAARYGVYAATSRFQSPGFPIATLAVNLLGSFLIGAVMQFSFHHASLTPQIRLFLTMGVMGGFTTFSAFGYETLVFLQQGRPRMALAYAAMQVIGCVMFCYLGTLLSQLVCNSR